MIELSNQNDNSASLAKQVEALQGQLALATAACPFMPGRFYGVSEVAEILGVSRKTVWLWSKKGSLPPIHGACRRFRGDQLAHWTAAGKTWKDIEQTNGNSD